MSTTPTYDAVLRDLGIDPEQIAARPAWSLELAEERVRQQKRAAANRTRQARSEQIPAQPNPTKRSGGRRDTTKRASAPK